MMMTGNHVSDIIYTPGIFSACILYLIVDNHCWWTWTNGASMQWYTLPIQIQAKWGWASWGGNEHPPPSSYMVWVVL